MNYDPAWDMPLRNWRQQGSFQQALIPLEDDPDDGPLVCLPPINQNWLPLVLGCLDQLVNPSTWSTTTDDQLNAAIEQAELLKKMLGVRAVCPVPLELRVDGCTLQSSTDGGDTWVDITGWDTFLADCIPPQTRVLYDTGCTLSQSFDGGDSFIAVPGWTDNFPDCVQKYTPIIGLPPNPGDKDPDQLACATAAYLAEQVIIAAMSKAVTAISDDLTLLQFGLDVVNIIPEFVLVTLAADAFSAIYVAVQEGTLSDFEDAITDATLLAAITCAIYGCIESDGYVKPENFDCIVASIAAISTSPVDVIDAITSYLGSLGAVGVAQLSQVAGLHSGEDCSTCGSWCVHFNFAESIGEWTLDGGSGVYSPGAGFDSTGPVGPWEALTVSTGGWDSSQMVTTVRCVGTMANVAASSTRYVTNSVGNTVLFTNDDAGPFDETVAFPYADNNLTVSLYSYYNGSGSRLTDVYISGTGTNPFLSRYGTGVTDC